MATRFDHYPSHAPYKDMNLFFFETGGLTEGLAGMTQYQVHDFLLKRHSLFNGTFVVDPKQSDCGIGFSNSTHNVGHS